MTQNALIILNSELYVAPNGELVATNDNIKFFPVDGLVEELINEEDELHIQLFQLTSKGMQRYFKASSEVEEEQQEQQEQEIDKNNIEIVDKMSEDFMYSCTFYTVALIIIFLLALWLKR